MPLSTPTSHESPSEHHTSALGLKPQKAIQIRGARVNTLKNISCDIPHRTFTVITGPSGSGKSSLAFDTLYAEGNRRYIESLSSYARQFLEQVEKPDVDRVDFILPSIALEQKNAVKNARSTVGTATDVYDYLRLIFGAVGQAHCSQCGGVFGSLQPHQVVEQVQKELAMGSRLWIVAPVLLASTDMGSLIREGFFRALNRSGEVIDLQSLNLLEMEHPETHPEVLALLQEGMFPVLIDRLVLKGLESERQRILEAVETSWRLSDGRVDFYQPAPEGVPIETKTTAKGAKNKKAPPPPLLVVHRVQTGYVCQGCHRPGTPPSPEQFSFNSPIGACATCEGFGRVMGIDPDKVIPNRELSLAEGAVHPFSTPANQEMQELLMAEAPRRQVRIDVPYHQLSEFERQFVMNGGGDYPGVRRFFDWLEGKRYKVHVRVTLARYRGYSDCPDCEGSRLKQDARYVEVQGQSIFNLCQMPIERLQAFFDELTLSERELAIIARPLMEVRHRLAYLVQVGLGYLTLSRQTRTLSGGESQRIHLATALGSALTGTLYVLDEPTVGLHARDTHRLISVLKALRDHGNTVVVVEHDRDVIEAAERVIDMGPGSGDGGGSIVFEGTVSELLAESKKKTTVSLTAQCLSQNWLAGTREAPLSIADLPVLGRGKIPSPKSWITIEGAQGNNLQNITVSFPKSRLVCVTGVSGSGKSTLIRHTLYSGYRRDRGEMPEDLIGSYQELHGLDEYGDVILVDQSPPARSVRSNPVTYMKAYDDIRNLFAGAPKAKLLGLKSSDFSFNTQGGRCETCEGLGYVTVDMQFMADVTMVCQDCQGKRFTPSVLSVELAGKHIDDVLNMTVDEALTFFRTATSIKKKLHPLKEIGLGYLRLGQSMSTLSGGEAQRLKLASYMRYEEKSSDKKGSERVIHAQQPMLFLFDEPTTGLHMADIQVLVSVFRKLVKAGHSLVVVEHNLDFIRHADYVVDIGPDGGSQGGTVVYAGDIEGLMACPSSHTGHYLKESFGDLP